MALTITAVNPATGVTGGREFVLITGTDFNIAWVSDLPRMEVYFGTEKATRVRVRSTTQLDCLTPIYDPATVTVKVKDLDTSVEASLLNGFVFARPAIGGDANQSVLWRTIEALVVEMRRQIIEEVVLPIETDFDDLPDGTRFTKIAKVPALVLDGPRIVGANGPLRHVREHWTEVATDQFYRYYPQEYVNLEFTLSGVDDHKVRLFNLQQKVVEFFKKNNVLRVLKNPSTPSAGYEEFDMRPPQPQDWQSGSRENKSNLKFFSGQFTLFGVPLGSDKPIEEAKGIQTFVIDSSQKT